MKKTSLKERILSVVLICSIMAGFCSVVSAENSSWTLEEKKQNLTKFFIMPYPQNPISSLDLSDAVSGALAAGLNSCGARVLSGGWAISNVSGEKVLGIDAMAGERTALINSGSGENASVKVGSEAYEKMGFQLDFKIEKQAGTNISGETLVNDNALITIYDAMDCDTYIKNQMQAISRIIPATDESNFSEGKYMLNIESNEICAFSEFNNSMALNYGSWYTLKLIANPKNNTSVISVYNQSGVCIYSYSVLCEAFDSVSSIMELGGLQYGNIYYKDVLTAAELLYVEEGVALATDGKKVYASAKVGNDSANVEGVLAGKSIAAPKLILGVYGTGGELVEQYLSEPATISPSESTSSKPQTQKISVTIDKPNKNYRIKAFLWNSIEEMIPYSGVATEIDSITNLITFSTVTSGDGYVTINGTFDYDNKSFQSNERMLSVCVTKSSDGSVKYLNHIIADNDGKFTDTFLIIDRSANYKFTVTDIHGNSCAVTKTLQQSMYETFNMIKAEENSDYMESFLQVYQDDLKFDYSDYSSRSDFEKAIILGKLWTWADYNIDSALINKFKIADLLSANAEEKQFVTDNSIILKAGETYFFKNGEEVEYSVNEGKYAPLEKEGELYLPAEALAEVIDADVSYENEQVTVRKGANSLKMTNGKSRMIVNGTECAGEMPMQFISGEAILPAEQVLTALNYSVRQEDEVRIATNNSELKSSLNSISTGVLASIEELFEKEDDARIVYKEDFQSDNPTMRFDSEWGGDRKPHGYITDDDSGSKCAYMEATVNGWEGYRTPIIERGEGFDKNGASYKLSFSYKRDSEFTNSVIGIGVFFYDGNTFKAFNGFATIELGETNKWIRESIIIPSDIMRNVDRNFDHDGFRIIIRNYAKSGVDPTNVKGKFYIDDVTISAISPLNSVIDAQMVADKYAAWYRLGDTVKYKPQYPEVLASAKSLKAKVYNYYGEIVLENTIPAETAIENGWTYTPAENGWYEVEFSAILSDGQEIPVVTAKSYSNQEGELGYSYLERTEFYVTQNGTKSMENRNESLYFSIDSVSKDTRQYADDYAHVADLVGFSGNRWISMDWGDRPSSSGGTNKGIESEKGTFDWTVPDNYITLMDKYGFANRIVCVLSTPKWASPHPEDTKSTSVGHYGYGNYLASDINDWTNFLNNAATRYKNKVNIWEIWNEPIVPQSAFWYDTPTNYNRMLSSAYDTIKAVDPNAKVSTAGMGNSNNFINMLNAMIADNPNILNKMDYYAAHGTYDSISGIKEILSANGKGNMPWINTEGYYGTRLVGDSSNMKAAKGVIANLMQYKLGAKITTFFSMLNVSQEYEDIERGASGVDYGMFRYYPYLTPTKLAASMHTFFELMEKNFSVVSEYEFDYGLKGVLCNNGSKKLLVVWQPSCNSGEIPESVKNCLAAGGQIMRMDGKVVDDTYVPAEQVVYLTDVNVTSLNSKYSPISDTALNASYGLYDFFKCGRATTPATTTTMTLSRGPLFDKTTFNLAGDIIWCDGDYQWSAKLGNTSKPSGYNAKHAVYVCEEGIYLAEEVSDSNIVQNATSAEAMEDKDCVKFAVKVTGANANDYQEFVIGKVNGTPTVYKNKSATSTEQPGAGYVTKGILNDAKVNITGISGGVRYLVFIPASQLWPYEYEQDGKVRLSVCVNNNNQGTNLGSLQWGGGITGSVGSELFGYGEFPESVFGLQVIDAGNGTATINGKKTITGGLFTPEEKLVAVMVKDSNGNYVYFGQVILDENDEFSSSISVPKTGKYYITVTDGHSYSETVEWTYR